MKSNPPETLVIENGKTPDELYNACLGFWLPPKSPYGNFQLKLMKLRQRIDEANRRLADSAHYWSQTNTDGILPVNSLEKHMFANEQAVYLMRRAADELISLVWCLMELQSKGEYPLKIEVDCIGRLLCESKHPVASVFPDRTKVLQTLNEISNAFKHSFVHSDITLSGRDEPRVHALALKHNKLEYGVKFHDVSLAAFVTEYSKFYNDGIEWLRAFSKEAQPQNLWVVFGSGRSPN